MAKKKDEKELKNSSLHLENNSNQEEETYSLNDDRRVKVLSPSAMVVKRFFRNRVAMFGLIVLVFMFLFSFLGGAISRYREDEQFYKKEGRAKDYAGATVMDEYEFLTAEGREAEFKGSYQSKALGIIKQMEELEEAAGDSFEEEIKEHEEGDNTASKPVVKPGKPGKKSDDEEVTAFEGSFTKSGKTYKVERDGKSFYTVKDENGDLLCIAYKVTIKLFVDDVPLSFEFQYQSRHAFANGDKSFTADGVTYGLTDDDLIIRSGEDIGYMTHFKVVALNSDVTLTRDYLAKLNAALEESEEKFEYTDEQGNTTEFSVTFRAEKNDWVIKRNVDTTVLDIYSAPSWEHLLGTDANGMDILTRLMYGGRISLMIGFIVELIATIIGIILGGISGYFGGWVDNLIMRIVDIFYCIPSMPIIIIIGAAMDYNQVAAGERMIFLMLTLGLLGWPGLARMVRGQILSLREQEFMTATEACGVRTSRRIFKHLIPNVIPQLIVSVTMGLGGTIITEATLSYLGLGVKYPFASWGNIISDVNKTYVLQSYWFVWIPAGLLLLFTVLAFNLVGDGLRDAFDPKMKR